MRDDVVCTRPMKGPDGRTYKGCRELHGKVFPHEVPQPPQGSHPGCRCNPVNIIDEAFVFKALGEKVFPEFDLLKAEWEEAKHPRQPNGEFGTGGESNQTSNQNEPKGQVDAVQEPDVSDIESKITDTMKSEFPDITQDEIHKASVLASRRCDADKAREPEATHLLQGVCDKTGGKMVGLEWRLKSTDSMARKVIDKALNKNISQEDAVAQITDGLRYTMQFDNDKFVPGFTETEKALKEAGYERFDHKFTNYFAQGGPYRGLNTVWINQKTGVRFELQFHTPESLKIKEQNHVDYDVERVTTDQQKRQALDDKMIGRYTNFMAPLGSMMLKVSVGVMQYYGLYDDNPQSPTYDQIQNVARVQHTKDRLVSQVWDKSAWRDSASVYWDMTGIGGDGSDYHKITQEQAEEFIKSKGDLKKEWVETQHPRDQKGEFAPKGAARGGKRPNKIPIQTFEHRGFDDKRAGRYLLNLIKTKHGFTYLPTHRAPKTGFGLSIYPEKGQVVDEGHLNADVITKYIDSNLSFLKAHPDTWVGGWLNLDDGQTYLDLSVVSKDKDAASKLCMKYNQKAYFDFKEGHEVYIDPKDDPNLAKAKPSLVHFLIPPDATKDEINEILRTVLGKPLEKFEENEHPRDPKGEFTDKGEGVPKKSDDEFPLSDAASHNIALDLIELLPAPDAPKLAAQFLDLQGLDYNPAEQADELLNIQPPKRGEIKQNIIKTLSAQSGVKPEATDAILKQWMHTSNDHALESIMLQQAAAKVFNVPLSAWQQEEVKRQEFRKEAAKPEVKKKLLPQYIKWGEDYEKKLADDMKTWQGGDPERDKEGYWHDVATGAWKSVAEPAFLNEPYFTKKDMQEFQGIDYSLRANLKRAAQTSAGFDPFDPLTEEDHMATFRANVQDYVKDYRYEPDRDIPFTGEDLEKTVGIMYAETQRQLAKAGYKPDDLVTVYRGCGGKNLPPKSKGKLATVNGSAIESWSLLPNVAERFGKSVLMRRVPVRDIVSTFGTGVGCAPEAEVVTKGDDHGQYKALIVRQEPND